MFTTMKLGTKIINKTDGEAGTILNGYAVENGQWTAYEVCTAYGIEVWETKDILAIAADNVSRLS